MKRFTKGALITALIFVIVGFALCAVGAGIGFHYSAIPQMIKKGVFTFNESWGEWNDWSEAKTEKFDFPVEEIRNLNIDMDCGDVTIEKAADSEKIEVEVKYQRTKTRRTVQVKHDSDTLDIIEDNDIKFISNDNVRVTVRIPEGKEFDEINLQNDVGSITVNCAMNVKTCNIMMDTGTCDINSRLNVTDKLYAEVDVGAVFVELVAADKIILNCDIGQIEVILEGEENDYNYYMSCDVGDIILGNDNYGGVSSKKEVYNNADKNIDISCDIGKVSVEYTK